MSSGAFCASAILSGMTVFTIVAAIWRASAPPTIAPRAATELVFASAGVTGGAASGEAESAVCGPVDISDSAKLGAKSAPFSLVKMD